MGQDPAQAVSRSARTIALSSTLSRGGPSVAVLFYCCTEGQSGARRESSTGTDELRKRGFQKRLLILADFGLQHFVSPRSCPKLPNVIGRFEDSFQS